MAKLGLKAYKSLLAMSMVTKECGPAVTHYIKGHLLAEYRPFKTTDITLAQKLKRPHFNTNLET